MRMYRCTRNKPYSDDVPGATRTSARQGHYIKANSVEEAIAQMEKQFPDEIEAGFTAEEWNED
jgi:gluconate kinase